MAACSGEGSWPCNSSPSGYCFALGGPLSGVQLFDVLEDFVARNGFQQSPQVAGRVDRELAQRFSAVEGAEGRLHHVFRVLLAAKPDVHLALDQAAEFRAVLLVQLVGRQT